MKTDGGQVTAPVEVAWQRSEEMQQACHRRGLVLMAAAAAAAAGPVQRCTGTPACQPCSNELFRCSPLTLRPSRKVQ